MHTVKKIREHNMTEFANICFTSSCIKCIMHLHNTTSATMHLDSLAFSIKFLDAMFGSVPLKDFGPPPSLKKCAKLKYHTIACANIL